MPQIKPDDFWKVYSGECKKCIDYESYCKHPPKEYTTLQKQILHQVGIKLGYGKKNIYKEICPEFLTVDIGYFSFPNYSKNSNIFSSNAYFDWDWDVAIEHENNPSNQCWRDELIKLWHIVCGLKVLITYNNFTKKCGKANSIIEIQKTITDIIGNRANKSTDTNCIQTPFLFIFFPSCCDNNYVENFNNDGIATNTTEKGMYDAVAIVYDGKEFRQLIDLPILRTNANIKNLTE